MRDVNFGWLIRYLHANGASFFFIFIYLHIARGLYYSSYKSPRVLLWSIGVVILIITIVTAFLGEMSSHIYDFYQMAAITTCCPRKLEQLKSWGINPIIAWDNLNQATVVKQIKNWVKGKSGVYVIVNMTNAKCYVGSAITGQLYMRFFKHLISLEGNKIVGAAVNKYSLENFVYVIIELSPQIITKKK